MKIFRVAGSVWLVSQLVACGTQEQPRYQSSPSNKGSAVKSSDQTPNSAVTLEPAGSPAQNQAMPQSSLQLVQQRFAQGGAKPSDKIAALADVAKNDKAKQVLDQAMKPEGVKEIVIDQAKLDAIQKAAEDGDFDALQKAIDAFFADIEKQFNDLLAELQANIPDLANANHAMSFEEMQKQLAQMPNGSK